MNKNNIIKILYIWDSDFPWDIRVEKICNSLSENGCEVHIVARNLKQSPTYELIGKLHVHRLKPWKNKIINYALSFPAFFSPYWKKMINRIIEERAINMIIVRDLPLAFTAIRAGEKYRIPIIFDMAEDYCAMIQEIWRRNKFHGFNLVVRNPYFASVLEKYVIKRFDHIIVVVEEARNLVLKKGVEKDKITIVGNTPLNFEFKDDCKYENNDINLIKSRFSIIYTGGITFDRGIDVVIHSIPLIREKIKNVLFVIIGKGKYSSIIFDLINKKILHDWILFVGWVDHNNLYKYIKASKLGIIPHHVTGHTNTTIPNKIFDYMACGIPVIASDAPPLKRIIHEEACGKTFSSGNSRDLADKIINMYCSEERFGEHGRKAVLEKYNWKVDEHRLMKVVQSVHRKSKIGTSG